MRQMHVRLWEKRVFFSNSFQFYPRNRTVYWCFSGRHFMCYYTTLIKKVWRHWILSFGLCLLFKCIPVSIPEPILSYCLILTHTVLPSLVISEAICGMLEPLSEFAEENVFLAYIFIIYLLDFSFCQKGLANSHILFYLCCTQILGIKVSLHQSCLPNWEQLCKPRPSTMFWCERPSAPSWMSSGTDCKKYLYLNNFEKL